MTGTWDTGNFANDGARDFLDELIERLSETVGEILADDQRAALDEDGEAVVMPTIDLLAVLCDRYGSTAPAAATIMVAAWPALLRAPCTGGSALHGPHWPSSRTRTNAL